MLILSDTLGHRSCGNEHDVLLFDSKVLVRFRCLVYYLDDTHGCCLIPGIARATTCAAALCGKYACVVAILDGATDMALYAGVVVSATPHLPFYFLPDSRPFCAAFNLALWTNISFTVATELV